jgi:hypothetical protein
VQGWGLTPSSHALYMDRQVCRALTYVLSGAYRSTIFYICLIRPKYAYFFQKFNPSPAQRRKKAICMGFTLKLPQKLSLDYV